ncbi:hypothetical protein COO60DRAFT_938493 [Scenedesmus sp. NREL 46B-D3]|nr:hypothetical protein COO60DRAFT_938493 [Scenedesmus sp. NREL 46B-D3]
MHRVAGTTATACLGIFTNGCSFCTCRSRRCCQDSCGSTSHSEIYVGGVACGELSCRGAGVARGYPPTWRHLEGFSSFGSATNTVAVAVWLAGSTATVASLMLSWLPGSKADMSCCCPIEFECCTQVGGVQQQRGSWVVRLKSHHITGASTGCLFRTNCARWLSQRPLSTDAQCTVDVQSCAVMESFRAW